MGLFSGKKRTYVSSVTYNLAGDIDLRPNYLHGLIISSVFKGSPRTSLGEDVSRGYLNGPGMRYRSFIQWYDRTNFIQYSGQTKGSILNSNSLNVDILLSQLPVLPNKTPMIEASYIGSADFLLWAERFVATYYPAYVGEEWEADIDDETSLITVYLGNGEHTFYPDNYDMSGEYIYASYQYIQNQTEINREEGQTIEVGSSSDFPSVDGWVLKEDTRSSSNVTLFTYTDTLITYSDGRPSESSSSSSTRTKSILTGHSIHTKRELLDSDSSEQTLEVKSRYTHSRRNYFYRINTDVDTVVLTEEIPPEVEGDPVIVKTTRITTRREDTINAYSYKNDIVDYLEYGVSDKNIFIYRKGTGNPLLDSLFSSNSTFTGNYMPLLLVRRFKRFIGEDYEPEMYDRNRTGFKKLTGNRYDKVVTLIKDNDSIDDINNIYIVPGVSLNTPEDSAKEYLYLFFKEHIGTGDTGTAWIDRWNTAHQSHLDYEAWLKNPNKEYDSSDRIIRPTVIPYPAPPKKTVSRNSVHFRFRFDIDWIETKLTQGQGRLDPNKNKKEYVEVNFLEEIKLYRRQHYSASRDDGGFFMNRLAHTVDRIEIIKQFEDRWERIEIWGLNYRNIVHNGKSADITAKEALEDDEESGFVIPLHDGLFKQLSLKDQTQISTAGLYLVFNVYVVKKQRWYQTGLFKVLFVVATIVISVYTVGAGAGLLGTAASVGASLGFTGIAAVIAGSIANAIAGIIVSQIITVASTAIFGDKIGIIVATIASMVAIHVGTQMQSMGTSMSEAFSNLFSADNWMQFTVAAGKGYSSFTQASMQQKQKSFISDMEDYAEQSRIIGEQTKEMFASYGLFEPLELMDLVSNDSFYVESLDSFLGRTLMTGSDIAQATLDSIYNFSETTLSTDLLI